MLIPYQSKRNLRPINHRHFSFARYFCQAVSQSGIQVQHLARPAFHRRLRVISTVGPSDKIDLPRLVDDYERALIETAPEANEWQPDPGRAIAAPARADAEYEDQTLFRSGQAC